MEDEAGCRLIIRSESQAYLQESECRVPTIYRPAKKVFLIFAVSQPAVSLEPFFWWQTLKNGLDRLHLSRAFRAFTSIFELYAHLTRELVNDFGVLCKLA